MATPRRTNDPEGARSPEELREDVEQELDELTDEAAGEEVERMAERDRNGVDTPNDEVNQSADEP
jgi:hypothetical protein